MGQLPVKLHLVDATYELFRAYYGTPPEIDANGRPVSAVRGLIQTLLLLLRQDHVTHVACAFDHEVQSFRNQMFDGYKTGERVPADLLTQFDLAERAVSALGIVVWPMVEFEADDALATAAYRWKNSSEVDQIVICSPDKDLTQMVTASKVVCLDRRRKVTLNEEGVVAKFGVAPESIADYLALVGDASDGIPGIPRWGAKSTAPVLMRYRHVEEIPDNSLEWDVLPRGAAAMASSLKSRRDDAMLFKELATLRLDVPLNESLTDLEWGGARRANFVALCNELGMTRLIDAPHKWTAGS